MTSIYHTSGRTQRGMKGFNAPPPKIFFFEIRLSKIRNVGLLKMNVTNSVNVNTWLHVNMQQCSLLHGYAHVYTCTTTLLGNRL